jgi:hypothetical protein
MMHGAPSSLSYSLHCTQHSYTTYTSDTIDQQHKTSNLKQVMQKLEVTNFRNFCLKNSGISGLGKNGISGNPEIGISGIAITVALISGS